MASNPTYKVETEGQVVAWWFNKEFSQAYVNFENTPRTSNACTVIAVLVACRFHNNDTAVTSGARDHISDEFINVFKECILFGNELHRSNQEAALFTNESLTVPEAITTVSGNFANIVEWRSTIYTTNLSTSLSHNIHKHLRDWKSSPFYNRHPDIYIVLIAGGRSNLFMIKNQMITIVDSHRHGDNGAFVAQAPEANMKQLCQWFSSAYRKIYLNAPRCYELSVLYFSEHTATEEATTSARVDTQIDQITNGLKKM